MTEKTQPTDAPLNSIELMKVVMQADEETRAFALRGTTNWAAHIGKAVQNAVLAKWGTPAGAGEPYAYAVYFPDQPCEELVHDLDDLTDDLTNREHTITKLFTTPQPTQAQAGAVPLIRQLVAALEGYRRNHGDTQPCDAERAGRAWLEGKQ